jgi:hypothetical protein
LISVEALVRKVLEWRLQLMPKNHQEFTVSIKTSLIFASLVVIANSAHAANVDCSMNYPDGAVVGADDGSILYPNGSPMRTIDGNMLYPNGAKLMTTDGTVLYPNGSSLKAADGSMLYQSGAVMRTAAGAVTNEDGSTSALVRSSVAIDAGTQLVMRAFSRGSSLKLRVKTQATELVVNIDDSTNVSCEFVKPIGHQP